MSFSESVIQAVSILTGLIFLAVLLRNFGVIKESHTKRLSQLVTQYTLPALIFCSLSVSRFDTDKLLLAVIMIVSQVLCALLAWGISCFLRLSRPKKGALILASTFPSSAFLGYAVVKQVYLHNTKALADAAVTSEMGVATVIFTLGVLIAIRFGAKKTTKKEKRHEMMSFFVSPIFIALVLGIAASFFSIPMDNLIVGGIYKLLHTIAAGNTILVTLTIGAMLHFRDIRKVLPIVILACLIKLVAQPLFSYFQSELLDFSSIKHQIVVLEAAMPTAAMTAVFSKRYGCDAELTTILVFATFVSSILTIVMMIFLLG